MATDTAGNMLWSHTYNPGRRTRQTKPTTTSKDFTLTSDGGMAFCGWSSRDTRRLDRPKLDGNGLRDTGQLFP